MFDQTAIYILQALTVVAVAFIVLGIPALAKVLGKN